MNDFADKLFCSFGSSKRYPELENRIKARRGNFKKLLTGKQYRQLYELLNDAETIEGEAIFDQFKCGLRLGVRLMTLVYADPGEEEA